MGEITVHALQLGLFPGSFQKLLAHLHERRRAAGSPVQAAEQFLSARFRTEVDFGGVRIGAVLGESRHGCCELGPVRAKLPVEGSEKGETGRIVERRVSLKHLAGERRTGGFATAGQELLAEVDQGRGTPNRILLRLREAKQAADRGRRCWKAGRRKNAVEAMISVCPL